MLEAMVNTQELVALHERSSYAERRVIAKKFPTRINLFLKDQKICSLQDNFPSGTEKSQPELEQQGYVRLGHLLYEDQIPDILNYFKNTL